MKIKVAYYGHCRKDGTYNMVTFDTEAKTFVNWDGGCSDNAVLVEALLSRDVDMLREHLEVNGYQNVTEKRRTK